MLLAGKMPEQQRFGNARRLGQLFGGRARKPFSGKKAALPRQRSSFGARRCPTA
jgi:hypothetical protein